MSNLFDDMNNQTNPAVLAQSGARLYDVHPQVQYGLTEEGEVAEPAQQEAEQAPAQEALESLAQPQEQEPVHEVAQPKETTKEYNFRVLREKLEQAEREKREKEEMLQRLLASQQTPYAQPQQPVAKYQQEEEDDDIRVNPDDIVEGKHLSKIDKKISKEFSKIKQELDYYKQQTVAAQAEARLKAKYRDLDAVLSLDNIKTLQAIYPSLARTLDSTQDLYDKGEAAYTMIKNLGIHQDETQQVKQKIAQNMAKPKPLATAKAPQGSESPLTTVNMYARKVDESRAEQLRREMDAAINGGSF